jgi:uncharacterized protein YbjQ (UPF0145 family)
MKGLLTKVFLCFSVVLLAGMNSCITGPAKVKVQNIRGDRDFAVIQPYQFKILGEVTGKGDVIYNARSGKITGDTLKYGYIDQEINTDIGALVQTGRFTVERVNYVGAAEIARANATAQLIDQATAAGADRIIYVVYTLTRDSTLDSGKEKITVEAKGTAVKLLLQLPEAEPVESAGETDPGTQSLF